MVLRKLLLITTALVGFTASPVEAGPVVGAVSFLFGGAGFGAVTSIWGISAGTVGFAVVTGLLRLGGSLILSRIAAALGPKPKQSQVIRELLQPSSLLPWRFVYGQCWAPGSPAPVTVKGNYVYACFLLNSRPSAGPFTVIFDKRPVEFTGDPYDFEGSGAAATNAPFAGYCQYWIGRGDQLGPPDEILAEAPEYFEATDGWQGLTVLWVRLHAGDSDSRTERWPATPPEVFVDGKWSLVHDPRDPAQDADDPATWQWSANQALCALDALRQNPLRKYKAVNLWTETFAWAADVADEAVAVKAGGTIPRYEANGVLVFAGGSEIEDQVQPLADAGASQFTRVGGKLGLVPGCWREPVIVLDDVLSDQPFSFTRYRPSGELLTAVSATYISPDRMYEDADTPIYTLAGAQAEDGGEEKLGQFDLRFVTDHRQGQRVAKIMGMRSRMQRTAAGVFPPAAFDLVAGSVSTLTLLAPYQGRNGNYEVEETTPGFDPLGSSGVALRCALSLREITPEVFAWDAETEEQDVVVEAFDPNIGPLQLPGTVNCDSDASTALLSGDSLYARIRFEFDPSASASVTAYEWEYKKVSALPVWQSGGLINAQTLDGDGDVFGYLVPVTIGTDYQVRVRALSPGRASDWVTGGCMASGGSYLADAPTPVGAIPGAGEIAVTFRAPNDSDYRGMEIWAAAVDDAGFAALLAGPVYGAANSTVTEVETGLGSAVTRYYFARSIDRNGEVSPFSASISETTT